MTSSRDPAATLGLLYGLAGFGIWGLFPLYFKALQQVPAPEVLAHRVAWSTLLLLLLLGWHGRLPALAAELRAARRLGFYLLTTLLLAGNWLIFIWASQHGRVLEASLGYYINPLVNVALGMVVLGERLNPRQWLAVALAAAGVGLLVLGYGAVPWVSLGLALTWGGYGLLRKKAGFDPMLGLGAETLLLTPLAGGYLLWLGGQGQGALGHLGALTDTLLVLAGLATTVPLLCFLQAAQRLRLSTIGLMQYLTPTLQFLLAVGLMGERLDPAQFLTFALIWLGLAVYSLDALRVLRRAR
ncbi:MAG TPA: EamA family transporter RarD [Candidatus Competibacteraceae bacterium]|nr:EamA family transporter RarD [Candidatus Competibacteraceae bacterium]